MSVNMQMPHEATLLRIFIGEDDKDGGTPLYESIVLKARENGLAGATVLRGPLGFGHSSHLHTTKILRLSQDLPMVIGGLARMSKVLVHTMDDVNLLRGLGLDRNVGLFPHGATAPAQPPWPRTIRSGDAPVIGCHGFFLRHKGIDKLIRAVAILRREWPGLKLRLVNARFPNPEHEGAIDECRALARDLGVEDAIEWHLDFLPVDRVNDLLSGCDLIVLPYDDSDDSASGAVSRIIVMAMRPTAAANSMYQAGASALPVAWMSQVTTSCAVPPKQAMATA